MNDEIDNVIRLIGKDPATYRFPAPPVCTAYWSARDWLKYILTEADWQKAQSLGLVK